MQKLMVATAIVAMVAASPAFARGGRGHGHSRHMHRHSQQAPSDPDKAGASSEKLAPEDAKIDQKIKSICRGC